MKIHIVQKGETLWKLAKKYGVNFDELKKLNSQLSNPDMIMPGMKIKIPGTGFGKNVSTAKSNTMINVGAKKEAPIQGAQTLPNKEAPKPSVTKAPVKEAPKPNVTKAPVKEAPKPNVTKAPVKEAPKPNVTKAPVKEAPIVTVKEKPKLANIPTPIPVPKKVMPNVQTKPVMPQPVIPEVDINNYYMVNMENMVVENQPQPVIQQENVAPMPMPQQAPMQVVQDECVPITPMMPGTGFCPPLFPIQHHFCDSVHPIMIQPMYGEESSSLFESHSHMFSQQPGTYMEAPQQYVQPIMGMQYAHGYMPQVPEVSAHGLHHHFESSSHPGVESTSHMQFTPYGATQYAAMPQQQTSLVMNQQSPYFQMQPVQVEAEEDCGCDGSESPNLTAYQHNPGHQQMFHQAQNMPNVGIQESLDVQMNSMQQQPFQPQMNPMQQQPFQSQMNPMQQQPFQTQMNPMQQQPFQSQMNPMQQQPFQSQMNPMQQQPFQSQMNPMQQQPFQPQMNPMQQQPFQPQMNPMQQQPFQPQMNPIQQQPFQPQSSLQRPYQNSQMSMNDYRQQSFQSFEIPSNSHFRENENEIEQKSSALDALDMPRYADESNE